MGNGQLTKGRGKKTTIPVLHPACSGDLTDRAISIKITLFYLNGQLKCYHMQSYK